MWQRQESRGKTRHGGVFFWQRRSDAATGLLSPVWSPVLSPETKMSTPVVLNATLPNASFSQRRCCTAASFILLLQRAALPWRTTGEDKAAEAAMGK